MAYSYIDNSGIIVPDTADLHAEVIAEWRLALGADITTTADTPQGVLIVAETLARESVANNNAQLANQINPNLAGGVFLDAICALMGIERRAASASVVPATLYGVPGTIVPVGARAKSNSSINWALQDIVQLDSIGQGQGIFVCTDTGPVVCDPGELNEVVDMVLGWEAVTNGTAAVIGANMETDAELANRRTVTLGRQGISTREAQISGLNDIDGVSSVAFRENVASTTQNIDGISMKAHSIWACVDGGDSIAIAKSLLKNKTDGAGYNGPIVVPLVDEWSGQTYNIQFQRAAYKPVYVTITVRRGREQADPVSTIPQSIYNWSRGLIPQDSGLQIGVPVSGFEVSGAVNYYNPGFVVQNVLLSTPSAPGEGPATIPVAIQQRAIILPEYVTVVVNP